MCAYPGLVSHRLVQGEAMKQSEIMKKKTRFPALDPVFVWVSGWKSYTKYSLENKVAAENAGKYLFLKHICSRKYFRYRIFKRTHKDPG